LNFEVASLTVQRITWVQHELFSREELPTKTSLIKFLNNRGKSIKSTKTSVLWQWHGTFELGLPSFRNLS